MKRAIIGGFAVLSVLSPGLCRAKVQSTLEGKQLVVRVYNKPEPRARDYKTTTATIRDGAIKFNYPDANEATTFVIAPRDQKGQWYHEVFGDGYHRYRYTEGPPYPLPVTMDELKGREVVCRVYDDTKNKPDIYRKMNVRIEKRRVPLHTGEFNESTFIAVFGEDQTDDVIKKVFGCTFYAWQYEKGMYYIVPQKVVVQKQHSYCWSFYDAIGNIVPKADVEVWLRTHRGRLLLGKDKLDEQGRLYIRAQKGDDNAWTDHNIRSAGYLFVVSHPTYGKVVIAPNSSLASGEVLLPCVPLGSEVDDRCVWGQVIDPNGAALVGALVESSGVRPKGGKWISTIEGQRHWVVADDQGRFRMYAPLSADAIQIGEMIPPECDYHVKITAPKGSNLFDFKDYLKNGRDNIIKMRPTYFHTFVFEGRDGPITDPKILRDIGLRIDIEPGKRDPYFGYREFKDGGRFPLGTYRAWTDRLRFRAIEVTPDSPEKLVFKLPAGRTYYGRVIEGVTGLSIADAQVKAGSQSDNTGQDGTFEIMVPPGGVVHRLIVSKENYLQVWINNSRTKKEDDGLYRVPDVKLFPAATVKVHPIVNVKTRHDHLEFRPQWHVYTAGSPAWAKDFVAACAIHPQEGIFRDFDVESGKDNSFVAPAGMSLRLHLRVLWDIEWAPVTIADGIILGQGEVLDLGQVEVGPLFNIFVDVRNSAGQPVEGVPVTACGDWDPAVSSSDEYGTAMFDFVGRSKGDFIVEYRPEGREGPVEMQESIPYNISGPEDANKVFTITVSDRMLSRLFE